MKFLKSLYINNLFFYLLSGIAVLYVFAFFFPVIEFVPTLLLIVLILVTIVDFYLIFSNKKGVSTQRILPEKLSNGDENEVKLDIKNNYPFTIDVKMIDEIPFQFQKRDFEIRRKIKKGLNNLLSYTLTPKERGEYLFGSLNIYVSSPIGIISKRYKHHSNAMLPSYPSFIHLPKYELMALNNEFLLGGIKKIRKIGHTLEFEQIKDYVQGDDIRTINWKATGKHNKLMVNQYQEERAQRIYMLIDQGRTMKMPFNGLTLLDYSINAAMALSHIVLKKKDQAGVMSFSRKISTIVKAESKGNQIKNIANALYNITTDFAESDFNRLYAELRHKVTRRSLILLFSNFETLDALQRQLPYLRAIAKNHVLVIVFFKNAELKHLIEKPEKENLQEIYDQIIAEKFEYEKKLIRNELMKYGIQSVYTLPENLSISVINKYLEIKARGIL